LLTCLHETEGFQSDPQSAGILPTWPVRQPSTKVDLCSPLG
jgi:hypothetical protein